VVGLDRNGNPLWADSKMPVYDYQEGQNDWERAQSTGCLSHDGSTYYFQTIGPAANGKLYAVNTADGSVRWSYATHSYYPYETWASSPIVTRNGIVVVGTNLSGQYLAVRDDGDHATLLDSLKVEPGPYEPYPTLAHASAVISADGKMYIPYRTYWTVGNGDNGAPSGGVEYCLTAFDLSGCDPIDGDLNGDCRVNIMDLAILSSNWLNCGLQPESRCQE